MASNTLLVPAKCGPICAFMVATTSSCHCLENRRRVPYSATRKSASAGLSVIRCIFDCNRLRPSSQAGSRHTLRKYTSLTMARTGISNRIVCSQGPTTVMSISPGQIGRAHVGTPVTNAHLVSRHLLDKKKQNKQHNNKHT